MICMRVIPTQITRCLQGFVEIYKGRETRHRAKGLAHATEYEFRLKVSRSLSGGQAVYRPPSHAKQQNAWACSAIGCAENMDGL